MTRTHLLLLLITFLASSCGYKGPLYLPLPDKPAAQPAVAKKPAPDDAQGK